MSTAHSTNITSTPALPIVAGKYRLIFELGRGGMADLVLAVVQGPGGFNKLQVLKLLRTELAAETDFCAMFLDEARLSARINHPNVAQTNEVGFDGERYFIAMEYLEGQSLDELTRRSRAAGRTLPLGLVLRALADACAGLHFAHELKDFDGTPLNVIHRDVSPQNIFVTYDGVTKLLDFGIAKASDSSIRTQVGTIKGKIAYMAPEQLLAVAPLDRRADIFAVGAILWRVITGKRMWVGASEIEILQSLANHKIPEPEPLPGIPAELVRICKKAIEPDPKDRYQTAAELKTELETLLGAVGGGSYSDISRFVSELFVERRKEIASAIEARLSATDASSVSATLSLPRLSSLSLQGTGSMELSSASARAGVTPVETSGIIGTPAPSHRWKIAVALLAIGAGVATAVIVRRDAPTAAPASVSASAPSSLPAASSIVEKKAQTELTFDVTPPTARVFIDDVALTGKPPHGVFPRDGQEHRVRVQADGYVTKTQTVIFDIESARRELTLEKERPATPSPAWRPPSKSRAATAATSSQPAPTAAPQVAAPAASEAPQTPPQAPGSAKAGPSRPPRPGMEALDKEDPWKK